MKRRNIICSIIVLIVITIISLCFIYGNQLKNETQEYTKIINPEYLKYLGLSKKEKENYYIIPDKYIIAYNNSLNESTGNYNFPEKFDLRNISGNNYITAVKNQGDRGLCWAFSTTTAMESALLYSNKTNESIDYSPYQIDFATSRNGIVDYSSKYNRMLEDGWLTRELYQIGEYIGEGYSPVSTIYFDESMYERDSVSYDDVFDIGSLDYYYPDYSLMYATSETTLEETIKKYIMDNGAIIVATYAPSLDKNCKINDGYYLNTNTNCYATGAHAMTVIGWDDTITYEYNGKTYYGSWILQNSWGEKGQYIYLGYNSSYFSFIGYGKPYSVNYNNAYSSGIVNETLEDDTSILINEFSKPLNSNETISRISFSHLSSYGKSFKIYFSEDNINYQYLETVDVNLPGRTSLDVTDSKYQAIIGTLSSDKFYIKIEGLDNASFQSKQIYVYTNSNVIETDEYIGYIGDIKDKIYYYSKEFKIDLIGNKKVKQSDLNVEIYDNNNTLVDSSEISLKKISYFNRTYTYTFNINKRVLKSNYNIKAYYKGNLIDSKLINIESLEPISNYGDGTKLNPFIITKSSELFKIDTNKDYLNMYYELGNNIDLSEYPNKVIGNSTDPFMGHFNGNGYTIKNYINNSGNGLFSYTQNAEIYDVKLKNFEISNNTGLFIQKDNNSEIYNIYILDSNIEDSSSGFIYEAYDGIYYNIYSNSSVFNSSALFRIIYRSQLSNAVYLGKIFQTKAFDSNILNVLNNNYISNLHIETNVDKETFNIISIDTQTYIDNVYIKINSNENYYIKFNEESKYYNNINIIDHGKLYDKRELFNIISISDIEKNGTGIIKEKFDLNPISWEYINGYPRLNNINYDINNIESPGTSNIYKFDTKNAIIYNVRMISPTQKLTKSEFIKRFTYLNPNAKMYDPNKERELNDDDIITTGTIVSLDKVDYRVAVMGNIYDSSSDVSNIDIADAIAGQRVLAKLSNDLYGLSQNEMEILIEKSGDINCNNEFDIADITYLRRYLAKYPSRDINIYESDGDSCFDYNKGDLQ